MTMIPLQERLETKLIGPITPGVRVNMRIDLVSGMMFGFIMAITSFVPVILRRSGATAEMLGLLTAVSYSGSILSGVGLMIMGRRSPLKFVSICWFMAGIVFLPIIFTSDPWLLLLLISLYYTVQGLPGPAYTWVIRTIYPSEQRGQAMALIRVGRTFIQVILTPLVGWALDQVGHRVIFPLVSLFSFITALNFLRLKNGVQNGDRPTKPSFASFGRVISNDKRYALYLVAVTFFGFGLLIWNAFVPIVQVDRLHLSYTQLGFLGVVQTIAWLLSYILWGKVVDRGGALKVVILSVMVAITIPICYIFANSFWILIPAFISNGIIYAGTEMGMFNLVVQLASEKNLTEYAAVHEMVIGFRGIITPLVGVWLYNIGVPYVNIFCIGIVLLVICVLLLLRVSKLISTKEINA